MDLKGSVPLFLLYNKKGRREEMARRYNEIKGLAEFAAKKK